MQPYRVVMTGERPAEGTSASAYESAVEYHRSIDDEGGGDRVVEAEPVSYQSENSPFLQTVSGHWVIEDGIAISQFDYQPPITPRPRGLRFFMSWLAAHTWQIQRR